MHNCFSFYFNISKTFCTFATIKFSKIEHEKSIIIVILFTYRYCYTGSCYYSPPPPQRNFFHIGSYSARAWRRAWKLPVFKSLYKIEQWQTDIPVTWFRFWLVGKRFDFVVGCYHTTNKWWRLFYVQAKTILTIRLYWIYYSFLRIESAAFSITNYELGITSGMFLHLEIRNF